MPGTDLSTHLKTSTPHRLAALNSRIILEGWNDTTVVLITKVDDSELVSQFRPISFYNIIYKIISKMMSQRLKAIPPYIIPPMQSDFNVLVAYESVHAIN
jgi:hypothetical protein